MHNNSTRLGNRIRKDRMKRNVGCVGRSDRYIIYAQFNFCEKKEEKREAGLPFDPQIDKVPRVRYDKLNADQARSWVNFWKYARILSCFE